MSSESQRRVEVAEYSRRLHARGWVANHDGNATLRLDENRFLATPTATSKAAVGAEDILVVDELGARVSGRAKPFGQIGLHLTVFRNRADVNAVIHAHPPTATGFAVSGVTLEQPMIAEAVDTCSRAWLLRRLWGLPHWEVALHRTCLRPTRRWVLP